MFDSSVAPLFDVNVSSGNRNCDNVTISIAGRENKELNLDNVHTVFLVYSRCCQTYYSKLTSNFYSRSERSTFHNIWYGLGPDCLAYWSECGLRSRVIEAPVLIYS